MKRFLLKTSLILLIVALPILACFIRRLNTKVDLMLPADKNVVVLGSSHTECAINDSLLPTWINLSYSGTPPEASYYQAKALVEANPQLDTLIMSVATKDFTHDTKIWMRQFLFDRLPLYDYKFVIRNMKPEYLGLILPHSLDEFQRLFREKPHYYHTFGAYKYNGDVCNLRLAIPAGDSIGLAAPDDHANPIKYFRKIVDLCNEHHVKAIFIHVPYYQASRFYNTAIYDSVMPKYFPDVENWNYRDLPLPDSLYKNLNHLTGPGAEVFTRLLIDERLRKKTAEE